MVCRLFLHVCECKCVKEEIETLLLACVKQICKMYSSFNVFVTENKREIILNLEHTFNGEFPLECDLSFTVFASLLAVYQSVSSCVPTPETKARCNEGKKRKQRENNKGKRTD